VKLAEGFKGLLPEISKMERLKNLPLVDEWKPNLREEREEKRRRKEYDARQSNWDFLLAWFQKKGEPYPPEPML
jgi:hypothetical protein